MSQLLNKKTVTKKSPIFQPGKNSFCYTCKAPIYDLPYRFLVVKNQQNKHKMISFHYFFPCWDIDFVCKHLEDLKIAKAGFICDSSIKKTPKIISNYKKNLDLWDI
ncbi:MAG: hypothetical protein PVG43_06765 [Nitrosopumilaceae archaeon]|jgi:hypothetical protein